MSTTDIFEIPYVMHISHMIPDCMTKNVLSHFGFRVFLHLMENILPLIELSPLYNFRVLIRNTNWVLCTDRCSMRNYSIEGRTCTALCQHVFWLSLSHKWRYTMKNFLTSLKFYKFIHSLVLQILKEIKGRL